MHFYHTFRHLIPNFYIIGIVILFTIFVYKKFQTISTNYSDALVKPF